MVLCFAWGCNTTEACGKALFSFPKDLSLRNQWISLINRNKDDFQRAKAPKLCEDHFQEDSFTKIPSIAKALGCRLKLRSGALPDRSLFKRKAASLNEESDSKKQRQNLAFHKRQNLEVSLKTTFMKVNLVSYNSVSAKIFCTMIEA